MTAARARHWYWGANILLFVVAMLINAPLIAIIAGQLPIIVWYVIVPTEEKEEA